MNEFDEIEELRQEVRALAGLIQHWLKRTEVSDRQGLDREKKAEEFENYPLYSALVQTNQRIKKLGNLSQDISRVAALISTIESRMNLLAINAAIEANKLGKVGLKLVIIADEVQHLANSFANYLNNIEEFVPKIQEDIGKVMAVTEEAIQVAIAPDDLSYASLEEKVDFINQTIVEIREYSQEISEIVNWIHQNVKKMNNLALNASVEAARFGETGKGFAVIADDISLLAKKSARSLEEIEAIAKQIHREISRTLQAKDKLIEQIRDLKTAE
ncbi:MAG: hypothetical protein F6K35_16840 [Okeania sp. SIO2H7]|nr:hypothetical protein [Okeania sp. SIO2H7]